MIDSKRTSPTMLLILDGFGYRKDSEGNAVAHANMPNWKFLQENYTYTYLHAAGKYVGLPEGYAGNSEVGHLCIGAGRIIKTTFSKINELIDSGKFFKNEMLIENFKKLAQAEKSLHLMGLLSDAGVHSHEDHLYAFIDLAKQEGIKNIFVHAFLDGRDTPPRSAKKYLKKLDDFLTNNGVGKIASLHGRFYAMDRDGNWDRTKKSYDVICGIDKSNISHSWEEIIDESYEKDVTDEFVEPTLINENGAVQDGDGIVFFNFRPDRARQLTESFINPNFDKFTTKNNLSFFISPIIYDEKFMKFKNDIFLNEQEVIDQTLLDEIHDQTNKNVFMIAETEKYAHVTYFFRGKVDKQLETETRVLVPSIKTKKYDKYPEMSANEITQKILESLHKDPAYFYLVNYANCDMVGHSGDFDAGVKACESVDKQLGILIEEIVEKLGGTIFLTADHGNVEEMKGPEGPKTSHTKNPVPFMIISKKMRGRESEPDIPPQYGLSNIAPTILKYMGLDIPKKMEEKVIDL